MNTAYSRIRGLKSSSFVIKEPEVHGASEPEARRQARGGDNPEHLGCTAGADGAAPYQGREGARKAGCLAHALKDQLDAAAAAGNDELTSARPAAVGTTHKTRSRAHMEALDNAIAELFYAENLPDELAESPHACTSSSTLHGRRQLHTSHQSGVGLSSFAARGEWWSVRATVRNLRAHSGLATRALARGCAARAAATDRWNAAVRQTLRSRLRSPHA